MGEQNLNFCPNVPLNVSEMGVLASKLAFLVFVSDEKKRFEQFFDSPKVGERGSCPLSRSH